MINVLEIRMTHEYKYSWNISAQICYRIHSELENCLLLYRYKLAEIIFMKFGTGDPSKIDISKLKGDNIFIFHIDVFKEKPNLIKPILDHCRDSGIDVYLPIPEFSNHAHIIEIKNTIEGYEHVKYKFTEDSGYENTGSYIHFATKEILRNIRIGKLINNRNKN